MSRTSSKRRRWARAQAGRRYAAVTALAQAIDLHRMRITPIDPDLPPGLHGILPRGWPWGPETVGSFGGRAR